MLVFVAFIVHDVRLSAIISYLPMPGRSAVAGGREKGCG